jgi:hypothetical protein
LSAKLLENRARNIHFGVRVAWYEGSARTCWILRQPALTSRCCADKNANFLRQAVSFANRNGRSANATLKDQVLSADLRNTTGLDE